MRRKDRLVQADLFDRWAQSEARSLWEMSPLEMLLGRWGTAIDDDAVIVEGGPHQLLRREGVRFGVEPEVRAAIVKAHAGRCLYCGQLADPVHLDHVLALSRGGTTEAANLVVSCESCNYSKGALSLAAWLRVRTDLEPLAIIERWEESKRQGRLVLQ